MTADGQWPPAIPIPSTSPSPSPTPPPIYLYPRQVSRPNPLHSHHQSYVSPYVSMCRHQPQSKSHDKSHDVSTEVSMLDSSGSHKCRCPRPSAAFEFPRGMDPSMHSNGRDANVHLVSDWSMVNGKMAKWKNQNSFCELQLLLATLSPPIPNAATKPPSHQS
jgi:hypothetical protein